MADYGVALSPISGRNTEEELAGLLSRLQGYLGGGVRRMPALSVRGVPPEEIFQQFLQQRGPGGGRPDITSVLAPEHPLPVTEPGAPASALPIAASAGKETGGAGGAPAAPESALPVEPIGLGAAGGTKGLGGGGGSFTAVPGAAPPNQMFGSEPLTPDEKRFLEQFFSGQGGGTSEPAMPSLGPGGSPKAV